jgi:hypothetical protein
MSDETTEPVEETAAPEAEVVEAPAEEKKAKRAAKTESIVEAEVEAEETVEDVKVENEITKVLSSHPGAGVISQHFTN